MTTQKMNNTKKFDSSIYDSVKEDLKQNIEKLSKGKVKYPKSKNSLSDAFISKYFAPHLSLEDLIWLQDARDTARANVTAKAEKESSNNGNRWFASFRAQVGERFFPEFGSSNTRTDENGEFIAKLIAQRKAETEKNGGDN